MAETSLDTGPLQGNADNSESPHHKFHKQIFRGFSADTKFKYERFL